MVFNMAKPDDEAFLKKYGTYKPVETTIPIRTIKPISLGETPEEAAARGASEGREVSKEQRDINAARLAQEAADRAARGEGRTVEDTKRKGFLDLVTKYEGDERVVKYQKVLPIFNTMLTVASRANPSKADDNLMVTYFSKIKDPSTGVLGGEYETAKNVQTAYDKALVDLQGLYDPKIGFVSPEARKQFIRATRDLVASDRIAYDAARSRHGAFAKNPLFGVNPEEVIGQDFAETYRDQIKEKFLTVMGGEEAKTAGGVPVLKVAEGDKFSTDKDIAIASELQGMWAAGKTLDEVNAKAIELTGGNPLSAETIKALNEDPQRTIRFTPNRSGIREGSASQIGPGEAAAAAAIRGYTSNLGEEILSTFSPEAAAKLQAAGEAGMENYPIISTLAEIPSSIASPLNKFTKFIPGGPVVRDIVEGGIYGGGEGRPDASALERAKTAAAGGILQSGFGAAARRFMPGGATPDGMAPDGSGIPEGEFVNVTGEVPAGMAPDIGVGGQATRSPSEFGMPTGAPSGMAPPTAGMAPPTGATPDMAAIDDEALDVGREAMIELARKAVSRGFGASKARAELAELAKIDPEAQAAAERLGIQLPVDVLGQNAQLQRVTGLARSQIGSEVETAWRKTYDDAAERAFKAMDELGAVKDISKLSKNVFDKLDTANKGLEVQAADLRDQVTQAIDVSGRVDATAIRSYLEDQIRKLGGGAEGLRELSGEEKKLWAMVSKGNPTYEALDKKRAEIGRAMTKGTGAWVDSNAQRINDIYAKLADDQMGFIESSAGKEIADKQRAANTLFKQMYDGRGQMQEIFGRNLSKDLGPLITTAITQGGKGGVEAINKLLENIPADMRGTVLTSGLFSTATDAKGGFSFTNFANTYSKLREQSQVFNQFAKAIGPDGVNLLNDFNAIGRRIANAQANIIPTGAANQLNALNAENLMLKILQGVGAAGAGAAATSVLGADLIQTVGGIIAAGGGAAFAQLKSKTNVQKLHDLMKSDKFRELAVSAATGEGLERNINRVAGSKEFSDYAKLVGIDMKDARNWLNSAIAKGATIGGTEAVGSKPDEAPTVEMPQ
jgi:hypothetical protein